MKNNNNNKAKKNMKALTQQTFVGLKDAFKMSSRHVLKTS